MHEWNILITFFAMHCFMFPRVKIIMLGVMNVQCPTQYIPLEPVWIGDKSISPQGYCYGPQIS